MALPQEVAEVAHFLLSDSAGYVSGMNYICDGCLSTVPL
jgi:NAD(P)-dependent dehydrogenase (short-subunit alcohol dehydrogenase family)